MNIVEILDELNIQHRPGREGWIDLDCPFCGRPYLGCNPAKNLMTCWKCGYHQLSETLVELSGRKFHEIKKLLGDLDRGGIPQPTEKRGTLVLPLHVDQMRPAHRAYLKRRGYAVGPLERIWGLKGIGIAATLAWRIFIPIHYRGKIVSWTTRSIIDCGIRYISASHHQESMPHKTLLFGEDFARDAIIITEGPFDVFRIGPGAVATMGIGFSAAQVLRMSKYTKRIVVFDSEDGAQRRAQQLCDQLAGFSGETFNVVLDSPDAGSASKKEVAQLRKLLD